MTTKYTPAPWHTTVTKTYIYDENSQLIAECKNTFDAQLIAAAPELLGALKALKGLVQGNGNDHITRACNDATRAIARAEGK